MTERNITILTGCPAMSATIHAEHFSNILEFIFDFSCTSTDFATPGPEDLFRASLGLH